MAFQLARPARPQDRQFTPPTARPWAGETQLPDHDAAVRRAGLYRQTRTAGTGDRSIASPLRKCAGGRSPKVETASCKQGQLRAIKPRRAVRNSVLRNSFAPMPRYFFDISGGAPFSDPDGEELPHDQAAWDEALRTVRDVETTLDPDKWPRWSLEVKRDGMTIFRIDVSARKYEI